MNSIRPDIRRANEQYQKIMLARTKPFLFKHLLLLPKIKRLIKKIAAANARVYREKINDFSVIGQFVSTKDLEFMAKINRGLSDTLVKWYQTTHPFSGITFESQQIDSIPVEWQIPTHAHPSRIFLHFHGGAGVFGSIQESRLFSVKMAQKSGVKVISVGYRLAPEYPFPAGHDDCFMVYKWLIDHGTAPKDIIVMGISHGGTLTLSTMLRAKEEGLPLPAGAICISPGTDMSFSDIRGFEKMPHDLGLGNGFVHGFIGAALGSMDPKNPIVSPYWGDLSGLPPLLVLFSTDEMLYFDNLNFVDKALAAHVSVKSRVWPAIGHGVLATFGDIIQSDFHMDIPEVHEVNQEIDSFIRSIFVN
jgi:monoterpene epsilon-lactone hydrolase